MAHDDRILSQAEIDSLLKRILPKTDAPAAKDESAPVKPAELPARPKEAVASVRPAAPIKTTEPVKSKEAAAPGLVTESIKMAEYTLKTEDTHPSPRPTEPIKRESSSDETTAMQKTITDLSEQVNKLTAAVQTITKLEEKVKQLETIVKIMPDSNRTLKARIDEISNVLEMLQDSKSDHTFLEGFKCSHCRSEGLVALYVKCTSCGKESWMGWWPDEKKKY